jgi:hypothetical protein
MCGTSPRGCAVGCVIRAIEIEFFPQRAWKATPAFFSITRGADPLVGPAEVHTESEVPARAGRGRPARSRGTAPHRTLPLLDDQLALHFLVSHPAKDRTLKRESSGLIRHEFNGNGYTFREPVVDVESFQLESVIAVE